MNKPTHSTQDYVKALPLTEDQKGALSQQLPAAVDEAFTTVHRRLSGAVLSSEDHQIDADAPLDSVKARVASAWPDAMEHGNLDAQDDEGRAIVKAMPPVKRSSMFPEIWRTNPVGRFWDALMGRSAV